MRGFKVAQGYHNIPIPRRSTQHSAAYDLAVCESITIPPKALFKAPTGLKAYMGPDEVCKLYARSSLAALGLMLPNAVGIIDADYYENPQNDGAIFVQLYNFTDQPVSLEKNTRIAQAMFQPFLKSDHDEPSLRKRSGGFGSTGR